MFRTRLISGIILLIIAGGTLYLGGNVLLAVLFAISCIGVMEFLRMINCHKTYLAVVAYLGVTALYLSALLNSNDMAVIILYIVMFLLLAGYVFAFPKYKIEQILYAFFGVFYVALSLLFIYRIRMSAGGIYLVWLVFVSSWGSDTCAYCVGRLIGKHKLAPVLSPNKTIEGSIGGILGSALIGFVYCYFAKGNIESVTDIRINILLAYTIISAAGAVISQLGDLAASAIKRNNGIKDYGKLIPGHGGILDRFDSVIFTAPIVYFLTVLLA